MSSSIKPLKTTAQKVDDLINDAKKDISNEKTEILKRKIKEKLSERAKAVRIVSNIDREIEELKLEIAQELESL